MEDAWILTGGENMEHLKSAAEQTVCIGITSWGTIFNRKVLEEVGKEVDYDLSKWNLDDCDDKKEIHLGKNHTHFLLVDDGYINKFDGELLFRVNLENQLTSKRKCKQVFVSVSVLCVKVAHYFSRLKSRAQKSFKSFQNNALTND